MAIIGQAVNLQVRPVQSVDLSFPVSGIIARLSAFLLGKRVEEVDFNQFTSNFSQTDISDPSRIIYNSAEISFKLSSRILGALRSDPIQADLDNAIAIRQNNYLTSYSDEMVTFARRVYDDWPRELEGIPFPTNLAMWQQLNSLLHEQTANWQAIASEYIKDDKVFPVIKNNEIATAYQSIVQDPPGVEIRKNSAASHTFTGLGEYRHLWSENNMRFHRVGANVVPALVDAMRMREKCRKSHITFKNELESMDRQIRKLQMAYMDTMLLPPFSGVVTGVYFGEGDFVAAGRPVIRLESDEFIYLVGSIKCRHILRVDYRVSVRTVLFDIESGQETTIRGVIASVRGHDSVNEQWDVLVRCFNRTEGGEPILPLNYSLAFATTTVEVTPV